MTHEYNENFGMSKPPEDPSNVIDFPKGRYVSTSQCPAVAVSEVIVLYPVGTTHFTPEMTGENYDMITELEILSQWAGMRVNFTRGITGSATSWNA